MTVTANYVNDPVYALAVNSSGASSVSIGSSTGHGGTTNYTDTVSDGTSVNLQAPQYVGSGASRKRFNGWTGSVTSSSQSITFPMSTAMTVTANYVAEPASYTITATAGVDGVINPNGTFDIDAGQNQQFTATPDPGYTVDTWYLNSEPNQIGGTTYTLTNIQSNHTVYVTFESTISYSIVGWGSNSDGQCDVPVGNDFIDIVAGYGHGLALRGNGSLEAWGRNTNGQCDVPSGNDFIDIAAWHLHSLAIRNDGSLEAWGWNRDGQCNVPAGNDFIDIAAGSYHSLALRDDGSLEAWGLNEYGTCTVPSGNDFVKIAAGARHNLALKADGSLEAWGYNYFGQCNVPAGNDFIDIAVGHWHSLAIRADGSMAAWGSNSYGQINVPDGNEFVDSAGGWYYTCAIKFDGSLAAWGQNSQGQCNVPVGNNFVDIAVGNYFGLALVRNPIYVDDDATAGANNGLNWDDAFVYLQDALSLAANSGGVVTEIRVAQGTYTPDQGVGITADDREATFQLINGVALKGGYFGIGAADPNERDISNFETILSGDLNGDDGPDFTNKGDNSYHVITSNGCGPDTVLSGFVITNGTATGSDGADGGTDVNGNGEDGEDGGNAYGGGMYCENSSLTISSCTFSNNAVTGGSGGDCGYMNPWDFEHWNGNGGDGGSGYGGGIYCNNSSPTITKCTFENNTVMGGNGGYGVDAGGHADSAPGNAGTGSGGGIYCGNNSNTIITNCIINNNTVLGGDGGDGGYTSPDGGNGYGGGIYSNSSLVITNCTLYNNMATGGIGGSTYIAGSGTGGSGNGGGLYCTNSPSIANCLFSGNTVNGGDGGPDNYTPGNGGNGNGGGLYCINSQPISNCTFYNNFATGGAGWQGEYYSGSDGVGNGGALFCDSSQVLTNSILWDNMPDQLNGHDCSNVSYCDMQDGTCGGLNGNFSADPLFADPNGPDGDPDTWEDNDYHLLPGSLCIDAGNTSVVTEANDLDGLTRIVDGDCDSTATVDMGAYELDWLYLGDFAGGCHVDLGDFAVLAQNWQQDNPAIDIVPFLEPDGVIDLKELLVLVEHWLEGIDIVGYWRFVSLSRSVSAGNSKGSNDSHSSSSYEPYAATATVSWGSYSASGSHNSTISPDKIVLTGSSTDYGPFYHEASYDQNSSSNFQLVFQLDNPSEFALTGSFNAYGDYGGTCSGAYAASVSLSDESGVEIYSNGKSGWDGYMSWDPVEINATFVLNPGVYTLSAGASAKGWYNDDGIYGPGVGGSGSAEYNIKLEAIANPEEDNNIYVDENAQGSNDGTSMQDAYNCLQDAIDNATSGSVIVIAPGNYTPADHCNCDAYYVENKQLTVQCVDPDDNATVSGTVIGVSMQGAPVLRISNSAVTLSGLTMAGAVCNYDWLTGGGVSCISSDVTIDRCVIKDNVIRVGQFQVGCGAGVYADDASNLTMSNTFVKNNTLIVNAEHGGSCMGGGIYSTGQAQLSDCEFSGNVITNEYSIFDTTLEGNLSGAGVYLHNGILSNCLIYDNHVRVKPYNWLNGFWGDKNVIAKGGGIFGINLTITDSSISTNSLNIESSGMSNASGISATALGGGLYLSNSTLAHSSVANNICRAIGGNCDCMAESCSVQGGSAVSKGGGVYIEADSTLENSEVINNQVQAAAGRGFMGFIDPDTWEPYWEPWYGSAVQQGADIGP